MKERKIKLLVLPSLENIKQVVDEFFSDVAMTEGRFGDLDIVFKDKNVDILHKRTSLKEFSFVWLSSFWRNRDLAYAIRLFLEYHGIPCAYVEKSTSKLTDHMVFALEGIKAPATLFLGSKNIGNKLDLVKDVCGYPLIIKDIKGSRGANSKFIENQKDLLVKVKELPRHKRYIFQKFVPNEYDWGVLVADGMVVSGEKSYPSEGEFRNNTCNGAKEVFVNPDLIPPEIKRIAIKANNALGLSWSRSDIIIDKHTQKPYLMEVNRFPGITSKTSEAKGAYKFLSAQIDCLER